MAASQPRKRNRPSAFDISFRDDPDIEIIEPSTQQRQQKRSSAESSRDGQEKAKRQHVAPKVKQLPHVTHEPAATSLELPDDYIPGEEDSEMFEGRPVRNLNKFTFIHSETHKLILPQLGMEASDFALRFFVEGLVSAQSNTEEDEGLDDDISGEIQSGIWKDLSNIKSIRSNILSSEVYIETEIAFYLLRQPCDAYAVFYDRFKELMDWTSEIIKSCRSIPCSKLLKDTLRDPYSSQEHANLVSELEAARPIIKYALRYMHDSPRLQQHVTVSQLRKVLKNFALPVPAPQPAFVTGNLDLKYLQPQYQNTTVVSSLLSRLSKEFFIKEVLYVVSSPYRIEANGVPQINEARLKQFNSIAEQRKRIIFPRHTADIIPHVQINGLWYRPGDGIFVPCNERAEPPRLPAENVTLFECFWLALIVSINSQTETMHVIWLEHSSRTLLSQIHDPQMVFMTDICDRISMQCVVGQAKIHFEPPSTIPSDEFYCRFKYNANYGSMISIDPQNFVTIQESQRCPLCLANDREDVDAVVEIENGLSFHNENYHLSDYVLIRNNDPEGGPARIGKITRIASPKAAYRRSSFQITYNILYRISEIKNNRPRDAFVDERHLYISNESDITPAEQLVGKIYVLHRHTLPDLELWLSHSALHFYVEYQLSSNGLPPDWDRLRLIDPESLRLAPCLECYQKRFDEVRDLKHFLARIKADPLRALDLFAGVGAFSAGIAEGSGGCIKVTHAIEIAPSTAKTCQKNNPEAIVYNQCANEMLKYSVKAYERAGHNQTRPKHLFDGKTPLGDPLRPEDIDVIICGVPCQPHSGLNMFKRVDDKKSNLILNLLSWVDFLRPRFVFLENVRGFTTFRLNAKQIDKYRVGGGIEMGGLKFVHHALTQMDYQVRCGLLQAGHYGIPQTRVRFFLIAARHGEVLPEFPQPTHDFPKTDGLEIPIPRPVKGSIGSIWTAHGVAAHPYVSVGDAISDLPRFDWRHPYLGTGANQLARQRAQQGIKSFACKTEEKACGFKDSVDYAIEPRTTFQKHSRRDCTQVTQHFTLTLPPRRVEQVLKIPLRPDADYQSLPQNLVDWMLSNPAAALPRQGHKPGKYFARLDETKWFMTTVTNLHPTAKQSKVLHPQDRRMCSVREFARSMSFPDSFVFESINGSVVTMHRQIGNSVPWLLASAIGTELRKTLFENRARETA